MKTLTVSDAEKEAGHTYVKSIMEGTQSGMVWNLIGDNTVTTTVSYCHNEQGEHHTTTMITHGYSNGFWNYELPANVPNDQHATTTMTMSTEFCNRQSTVMVMNEAKLNDTECARLWHWRTGHAGPDVTAKMGVAKVKLNEDCYCCDQLKYKAKSFKRNSADTYATNEPY